MDETLQKYLVYFKKIKRGYNKGFGKAPHKPLLLLSIIQLAENALLRNNRLFISSDIILAFRDYFKALVKTGHINNFVLPFYHMGSEPFYKLIPKIGMAQELKRAKSIKNLNKLMDLVSHAEIDYELFELLQDSANRLFIKNFLLNNYFPSSYKTFYEEDVGLTEHNIEMDILNETGAQYQVKLNNLSRTLGKDSFEEEVYIRGGVFKKTVPKIYDYSCCISGMKIISSFDIQMVDACHIVPFSFSQNDTVRNGISLSPNMHRAFDRGLITIDSDYSVRVSPILKGHQCNEDLNQYEGKRIILPENTKYFPSLSSLEWHAKEIFLQY